MKEGTDYTILADGRLVFTASYLLGRGYCCGSGCLNCPYDYVNVSEPRKSILLKKRQDDEPGKEN